MSTHFQRPKSSLEPVFNLSGFDASGSFRDAYDALIGALQGRAKLQQSRGGIGGHVFLLGVSLDSMASPDSLVHLER